MAKGDKVTVIYDIGNGGTGRTEIVADKAGRSVEVNRDDRKGVLTVEVVGRAGTAARTATFRSDRVIVVEETPA